MDVVGWRLDDVVNLIRGKKDTTVRLEIVPADQGQDGKHEMITLVRQKVAIEEQAAKKKVIDINDGGVDRKIGVIELPMFYSDFGARSRRRQGFQERYPRRRQTAWRTEDRRRAGRRHRPAQQRRRFAV